MRFISKIKHELLEPRIPGAVFLLFIFFAIAVTWYAMAQGRHEREMNLFAHYGLGQEVRAGDLSFLVEKLRRDPDGAGPLVPRPGHEFLIPTIVLENNGETAFDFMPLLALYVKDSYGNVYEETAVPSEGHQLSGPLLSHDILREEVGFEVPSGASGLVLYFEAGGAERRIIAISLEHRTLWQECKDFLLYK